MPPKKPLDDAKVMDVSKPGSTKPVATSRPVMAQPIVTTLGAVIGIDKQPEDIKQPNISTAVAPSQAHRTIAPISADVKPEEDGDTPPAEPKETGAGESEPATKADDAFGKEEPKGDDEDKSPGESSESAEVGALADVVATKKAEEKEVEEQTKKEAAVQEMINSKKYFVPLAHDSTKKKKSKAPAIFLLVLLVALVAGYAVVDEGIVDPGFDVPYHVLKK